MTERQLELDLEVKALPEKLRVTNVRACEPEPEPEPEPRAYFASHCVFFCFFFVFVFFFFNLMLIFYSVNATLG